MTTPDEFDQQREDKKLQDALDFLEGQLTVQRLMIVVLIDAVTKGNRHIVGEKLLEAVDAVKARSEELPPGNRRSEFLKGMGWMVEALQRDLAK